MEPSASFNHYKSLSSLFVLSIEFDRPHVDLLLFPSLPLLCCVFLFSKVESVLITHTLITLMPFAGVCSFGLINFPRFLSPVPLRSSKLIIGTSPTPKQELIHHRHHHLEYP